MVGVLTASLCLSLIIIINIIRSNAVNSNPIMFSEADYVELSFDEVVSYSTHIVNAEYVGEHTSKYGTELMFKPVKILKGEIDTHSDNVIYVQPIYINSEQEPVPYQKNMTYMLFLEKNSSVYYEHDKYVQLGKEQVSSSDSKWDQYSAQIPTALAELGNKAPSAYGTKYTNSTEIKDILEVSSNIFVVKIEDVYAKSTVSPTTVYRGSVTKTIRNNPVDDGNILITLFNDTVDIGNEYVLLLADASQSAPVYTLSSKNSVYSVEAMKAIPELEQLLYDAIEYKTIPNKKTDEEILLEEQEAASKY